VEGLGQLLGEIEAIENTEYKYYARCKSSYGELYKVPISIFKEAMAYSKETCDFINQSIFRKKKYFETQTNKVVDLKHQLRFPINFGLYRSMNKNKESPIKQEANKIQPLEVILPKIPSKEPIKLKYRSSLDDNINSHFGKIKYLLQRPAATLKIERVNVSLSKVRRILNLSRIEHSSINNSIQ